MYLCKFDSYKNKNVCNNFDLLASNVVCAEVNLANRTPFLMAFL